MRLVVARAVRHCRAAEFRASEVRASEVRVGEVRANEVRANEVRANEVRADEVNFPQSPIFKVLRAWFSLWHSHRLAAPHTGRPLFSLTARPHYPAPSNACARSG